MHTWQHASPICIYTVSMRARGCEGREGGDAGSGGQRCGHPIGISLYRYDIDVGVHISIDRQIWIDRDISYTNQVRRGRSRRLEEFFWEKKEHETEAWGRLIFVETSPVPATSSSHAVPDPPPLPGLSSPSPAPPAPHAPPPLHPSTTSIPAVFAEQIVKWFEDQNQRREARRQKKKEPTPPPPPPPSDPPPQPRYRSRSGRETNRVNYREPQRARP